jgi:8-amino-7-oxononanoate synthase
VGGNRWALEVAGRIQAAGFDARAVRPPTVPEGTARLRLSVHACHTAEQIDRLAATVAAALEETRPAATPEPAFGATAAAEPLPARGAP